MHVTLLLLNVAPKHQGSDAGNSDMPRLEDMSSLKVLPVSEKGKVFSFNKERKEIVC